MESSIPDDETACVNPFPANMSHTFPILITSLPASARYSRTVFLKGGIL
jgi:hypothetical protein